MSGDKPSEAICRDALAVWGNSRAMLNHPNPLPFKSTDMPGAYLLISFVLWRLKQNTLLDLWQPDRFHNQPGGFFSNSHFDHVLKAFLGKDLQETTNWNHSAFLFCKIVIAHVNIFVVIRTTLLYLRTRQIFLSVHGRSVRTATIQNRKVHQASCFPPSPVNILCILRCPHHLLQFSSPPHIQPCL